jgi:glycosyltransferase involved in cell wall biosynthesis
MDTPTISVIIPTLNEEAYLPKLLESLAKQTVNDFEVIVSDGPSKDKTRVVAKSFADQLPAFTLVTNQHAGLPVQRNDGAKKARGEWFIFIDADSVLLPYAIERILIFIHSNQPTIFTTWFRPDSEVNGDAILTLFMNFEMEGSLVLKRPHAPGPLAAVRKDAYRAVGGYDESLNWLEDLDFSTRLYKAGYHMSILRETLGVWSLRRFRKQGTLKVAQTYVRGVLQVLFGTPPKEMPGYIMGGHFYKEKKNIVTISAFKQFQTRFRLLMTELFE